MQLSVEQLKKIAEKPLRMEMPCHSQAVEHCVRMVAEASSQVYGMDARDSYIGKQPTTTLVTRALMLVQCIASWAEAEGNG